jgi:glucose-1-phosphate thymidylyltransferase
MTNYKGIVLAGGSGTRLHPLTLGVSKQLLPVYDKPLIYYPISVLMLAGIKDILLISTSEDINSYKRLLRNGEHLGVSISYEIQPKPEGLAQAFLIGENFIGNENIALVLGDNIFYGQNFSKTLSDIITRQEGATLFGYHVNNPEDFGIVEFNSKKEIISIEEKPKNPKSNCAVTGLYFYDNDVISIAKSIQPSHRGELEITDINKVYLSRGKLNLSVLGRGFAWLDTGTHNSLMEAGQFIHTIEKRQGLKVACLEEIAYRNNWINEDDLNKQAEDLRKTEYGKYLRSISRDYS